MKSQEEVKVNIEIEENEKLVFISRHKPNNGQIALAKELGYSGIKQVEIEFSENPIKDLKDAGIKKKTLGIVAPRYVTNTLLNDGYKLIDFMNDPIKRKETVFCCKCAYIYILPPPQEVYKEGELLSIRGGKIVQKRIPCPIPIDEQYESSLI